MAANTQPIFPLTPKYGITTLTTADTSLTTPTTNGVPILTGATDGTRIDGIKARALGGNVDTVLRIFFCDGLGTASTNFTLVYEVQLPTSSASTDNITGDDTILLPINYDNDGNGVLPPYLANGQQIYVSLGTTVISGYAITIFGGDY